MTARVASTSAYTSPLGPGAARKSSQLNNRNPPMPSGAAALSCGPAM
jgi:hypothetical protein